MSALFQQSSFAGGLDVELDPTKTPDNSYPLLVNGRSRRDVLAPTQSHLELAAFEDVETQGVFAAGEVLIVFAGGVAYYGNLTQSPVNLVPVAGWTVMNTTGRIYAALVTSTTSFFNRAGTPDAAQRIFNGAIQGVPQALFVFDGANQSQALFINTFPRILGTYESWTKDQPEYVPIGVIPCVQNNKLFLVTGDRRRILNSVSGRMSDFVVNIDSAGEKGGNAETIAVAVSYHEITSLRAINSGQVFVTTLYASYVIDLDYTDPIFAEPNLRPSFAFGVGCVNDISFADLLGDSAFITQSGIQSFNAVAQVKKESNNFALGAKIRGLLLNPQTDTCATNHDDYALFAVSTIYGRGVLIYDTTRSNFQSLDLSFGAVKQFANTRVAGLERLFYVTQDNKVFEAYAGGTVNPTRCYLGEWFADIANQDVLVGMVDLIFVDVKTSGECKITIFSDGERNQETVVAVTASGFVNNYPIQIPFTSAKQIQTVGFQPGDKVRAWKVGVLVEWNFDGALSNISLDGTTRESENPALEVQTEVESESFAFVADTGFGAELNDSVVFEVGGYKSVDVVQGSRYIYDANGDGELVTGRIRVTSGVFRALTDKVAIGGTAGAVPTFSLKLAENFLAVQDAILESTEITAIIGGGDHSYPDGTALQVGMGSSQFKLPFHPVAGDHDYNTTLASAFFAHYGIPRYYSKAFNYVEFFFYNGGWTTANVGVDAAGITVGATSEPMGNNSSSLQAGWLRHALSVSTAKFKIIVVHEPPFTTDDTYSPGYADLQFLLTLGADAVLSGHGHNMERRVTDGVPSFVCGTGGESLNGFRGNTDGIAAFRDSDHFGYLALKVDPLTCLLEFRDTENNVLDSFALYAK